jgi:F-type H+-transporting ATPase subunit a
MNHSPLETTALLHIGPVAITEPVIVTWVIMTLLTLFAIALTRRLSLLPSKAQTVLELFVSAIDSQIRDTMQVEPGVPSGMWLELKVA